jgi:hypothetical protein
MAIGIGTSLGILIVGLWKGNLLAAAVAGVIMAFAIAPCFWRKVALAFD